MQNPTRTHKARLNPLLYLNPPLTHTPPHVRPPHTHTPQRSVAPSSAHTLPAPAPAAQAARAMANLGAAWASPNTTAGGPGGARRGPAGGGGGGNPYDGSRQPSSSGRWNETIQTLGGGSTVGDEIQVRGYASRAPHGLGFAMPCVHGNAVFFRGWGAERRQATSVGQAPPLSSPLLWSFLPIMNGLRSAAAPGRVGSPHLCLGAPDATTLQVSQHHAASVLTRSARCLPPSQCRAGVPAPGGPVHPARRRRRHAGLGTAAAAGGWRRWWRCPGRRAAAAHGAAPP